MTLPFTVSKAHNPEMRAWDLMLLVGGIESESDAEYYAKLLANFMTENGGFYRPAKLSA